ncbi:sigma-70 family RNA polymerase sigma factor [Vulcanococcus sp.]|uniref:sigma-70 family RNA polymerase sigma factor n=1 Tax=Vulcanococcus sp. TaxID=2856995 RepID=UPI003F699130
MTTFHARADYRQRNADLIATYQRCRSIANRNAVIHANLPLVWRVARQEAKRSGHNFDDLTQEGCFGLVQAVERFDPSRGHTLSTAATPWIRGAIRHYLRDRSHAVSGSHHLLELHRRGQALQELRQQQGLQALSSEQLAEALGCSPERWQLAVARRRSLQLASLEQPQVNADGQSASLAEQLQAPEPQERYASAIRWEQRRQIWRVLQRLERQQRRLLLARILQNRTWRDLTRISGLSPKVTQRQNERLLLELRHQLMPLLGS